MTSENHPGRVLFLDRRDGQCCWPLWRAGAPVERKMVCGAGAPEGAPYCAEHRALAHSGPIPREEIRAAAKLARAG
ncbi:hypothetical protein [Microcystis phage Mwe-JY25]